ncbi:MAG: hypothetical protein ABSD39_04095 [Terriglobales bacterium]|jgi:hypothetical protein
MTPTDALEIMRRVNDNLRSALLRLRPERRHCSTLRPQDFSDLLGHLVQASECLKNIPSAESAMAAQEVAPEQEASQKKDRLQQEALAREALEYRGNLETLKRFLPDLHVRLMAERVRLETARSHVAAAAAWAGVNKKTL